MEIIDGGQGEGGGQLIRMSLSLAVIERKDVSVINIRAGRAKPGLGKQHLAGINLLTDICRGICEGNVEGSTLLKLKCTPTQPCRADTRTFECDIGSAGSISLVIQIILPVLARGIIYETSITQSQRCAYIQIRGGTNTAFAPAIDHFNQVLSPLLSLMGVETNAIVEKRGFYPRGAGHVFLTVSECLTMRPIRMVKRGDIISVNATIFGNAVIDVNQVVTRLRMMIQRQLIDSGLVNRSANINVEIDMSPPVKNEKMYAKQVQSGGLLVWAVSESGCRLSADHIVSEKGSRFLESTIKVDQVVDTMRSILESGACFDEHTADQLISYMALAATQYRRTSAAHDGASQILCAPVSSSSTLHLETACKIAEQMTRAHFTIEDAPYGCRLVTCTPPVQSDLNSGVTDSSMTSRADLTTNVVPDDIPSSQPANVALIDCTIPWTKSDANSG